MFESKYSKVLTVILVIVILAVIGLLGFLSYDFYQNSIITKDTSDFVDNFQGEVTEGEANNDNTESLNIDANALNEIQDSNSGERSSSTTAKKTYKGFGVLGTIEIPATDVKYPVLEPNVTTKKLETAVVFLFGTGLNQPGNSVIIGHNYRNGLFFSNNKKLKNGDKIYITDNSGKKLTYTIYNKFETTPEDTSFYQRDTGGKPEITLSTCTDDTKARIIIFAKAD